ncbi:hypothetical protein JG688_00005080 [Phytophthora aleatoria]|uniref:Uncharacterized protein n=1 Tax=Phytophthora aleatoria TaxID=2496075 RepID=A0A8J5IVL2_9STRA|nr:hypothetical protein JG688_00005080 [Phytophthora aleatoria]
MASDYTGAHQAEVRHSARAVKHWICAIPFRDELGNVYESYANNIYNDKKNAGSAGGDNSRCGAVAGRHVSFFESTGKGHQGIWQRNLLLVKGLGPLADSNSRVCVERLTRCIHLIPQKSHREKYLKTIKKWKKSIDRYH